MRRPSSIRARFLAGVVLGLVGGVLGVAARVAVAQDVDPLVAIGSSDPMALARAVDRIGDDGALERLAADRPLEVRLAAVRATPGMRAPERALEPLAEIAGGRDPDLAPAAALSILAIARALDPRDLDAREVLRGELVAARDALQRVADDASARADLRRACAIAVEVLAHAGVGAAPA